MFANLCALLRCLRSSNLFRRRAALFLTAAQDIPFFLNNWSRVNGELQRQQDNSISTPHTWQHHAWQHQAT